MIPTGGTVCQILVTKHVSTCSEGCLYQAKCHLRHDIGGPRLPHLTPRQPSYSNWSVPVWLLEVCNQLLGWISTDLIEKDAGCS